MKWYIYPIVAVLLFSVLATSGCDTKSTGQKTYTGIVTSISYDGGNKVTKLTMNITDSIGNTTLFVKGVVNGIEVGSKYRIVIENQEESGQAIPAKLISVKKL
jgi:hypothetical protein